jgi:GxxExxY protein
MISKNDVDQLSYAIIGCAIEVHKTLGPGLLESVYHKCLMRELQLQGLEVASQIKVPIHYKNIELDAELRLDLLVNNLIVVELKSVECLNPVYDAQVLTYMRLLNKPKGILINFCCTNIFKRGQKTYVNEVYRSLP